MKRSALYALLVVCMLSLFCKKSGTGPDDPREVNHLPLIQIETQGQTIENEPKIDVQFTLSQGDNILLETPVGIEYRGASSNRLWDKRSYGFETRDEDGEDRDVKLLSLPEEEDWILYGPYSDKTLLRNLLLYDLARELGHYASRTELVELEVNNEFMGTYVLMEKLKRDKLRLDITDLDTDDISPDKVTGGYILKIDKTAGDTNNPDWSGDEHYSEELGFRSRFNANGEPLEYAAYGFKQGEETYFLYDDPSPEDITREQKEYIQTYINEFEQALLSDDFSTSNRAYTKYIDIGSFVDFFLLNELSANPDAYRLSTFMHKDRDGKLKMGPVWDFNIAWGNDYRSNSQQWVYQYNQNYPGDLWQVHFWWPRLVEDPQFKAAVQIRWKQQRTSTFNEANLEQRIEEYTKRLLESEAIARNFERWDILGVSVPFNSYVGQSYDDEITYLKTWISSRLQWLDKHIGEL